MILVTGHRGFIGSKLVKELGNAGFGDLFLYDIVEGDDLRDYFKLAKVFKEHHIDTVIHLAARAGVRTSKEFPEEYISTNVQGTYNILRCAEEHGAKVIFFSSSSVFGSQKPPNNEDTPLKPESLYASTKAMGEMMCNASKAKTCIIRPFTVYGENGRKDQVIFKWLECHKAGKSAPFFGDGKTKRGYTYVGDLVEAVIELIGLPEEVWPESFNLGGSQITTLEELLNIFKSEIPNLDFHRLPLPDGDVAENYADTTKAQNLLGFKADRNLEEKVRDIIRNELN